MVWILHWRPFYEASLPPALLENFLLGVIYFPDISLFFRPCHVAFGILVLLGDNLSFPCLMQDLSSPTRDQRPPAMTVQSLNHCTTRKVPIENFLKHTAHPVISLFHPLWAAFPTQFSLPRSAHSPFLLSLFFFWLSLFCFATIHCSHILSRETDIMYFIVEHFRRSQNILRVFGVHLWAEGY